MSALIAAALYGAWACLRLMAWPFTRLGILCIWIASPLVRAAGWCLDKAREWDPRLQEPERRPDLRPPPGA